MKNTILIFLCLFIFSCGNSGGGGTAAAGSAGVGDFTGYTMTDVSGSPVKQAMKRDAAGKLLSQGAVLDGKKTGAWFEYFPNEDGEKVKSVSSYIAGMKNGAHMEFNNRGQLQLTSNFSNDQLNGKYLKYKFGSKIEQEIDYLNGQFHGVHKTFYQNGKLQTEINYKNNVQDGKYLYYNEEGQITMDYDYKDGKKVGGGMVTPTPAAE